MVTITTRALTVADRADWERLFRGYIAFYEAAIADDVIEQTFHKLLSSDPGTHSGFVAVGADDRAIGIAHMLFHPSTWSKIGYVYLEDLYVDPATRGGGAGTLLIQRVLEEADRLGATRTYWTTQEFNSTARRLYEKVATKAPFVQYRR